MLLSSAPFGRGNSHNFPTQWLHWIVCHAESETDLGQTRGKKLLLSFRNKNTHCRSLVTYNGPSPPPASTNIHRYVLVLLSESAQTPKQLLLVPETVNENGDQTRAKQQKIFFFNQGKGLRTEKTLTSKSLKKPIPSKSQLSITSLRLPQIKKAFRGNGNAVPRTGGE